MTLLGSFFFFIMRFYVRWFWKRYLPIGTFIVTTTRYNFFITFSIRHVTMLTHSLGRFKDTRMFRRFLRLSNRKLIFSYGRFFRRLFFLFFERRPVSLLIFFIKCARIFFRSIVYHLCGFCRRARNQRKFFSRRLAAQFRRMAKGHSLVRRPLFCKVLRTKSIRRTQLVLRHWLQRFSLFFFYVAVRTQFLLRYKRVCTFFMRCYKKLVVYIFSIVQGCATRQSRRYQLYMQNHVSISVRALQPASLDKAVHFSKRRSTIVALLRRSVLLNKVLIFREQLFSYCARHNFFYERYWILRVLLIGGIRKAPRLLRIIRQRQQFFSTRTFDRGLHQKRHMKTAYIGTLRKQTGVPHQAARGNARVRIKKC